MSTHVTELFEKASNLSETERATLAGQGSISLRALSFTS
jgi:hypothetical protein